MFHYPIHYKFFDIPLIKTAPNPNDLYRYLDVAKRPKYFTELQQKTLSNMVRERQFGCSGTIPPLRPMYPDRFSNGSRLIETNNANFVVEPNSIYRLKYKKTPKLHQVIYDDSIDAALKIGIGEKERKDIADWLKNGKYKDWKADTLMSPKTRRVLHKLDVIRKKTEHLNKKNLYIKEKQKWMVPKRILTVSLVLTPHYYKTIKIPFSIKTKSMIDKIAIKLGNKSHHKERTESVIKPISTLDFYIMLQINFNIN